MFFYYGFVKISHDPRSSFDPLAASDYTKIFFESRTSHDLYSSVGREMDFEHINFRQIFEKFCKFYY